MERKNNTNSKEDGKTDIISFYSTTKGGIDNLDKLARGFRSKRKSRRWPCSVFFKVIDVGPVAAQCSIINRGEAAADPHYSKRDLAYALCTL